MMVCLLSVSQLVFASCYALQADITLSAAMEKGTTVGNEGFLIGLSVVLTLFYGTAVAVSFLAYREFKGMM